ncbi:MAG: bifunctional UDP-N-acetylglucosamine diphosphorylase/glucosamine-1-phosphate N-acetyltransferase GlmU [Frankiaceae bacterium]|nr:bifunctional UDP-N-acetylglucosamine diphosphorylase/glucosamine-1-phosphate N-acetyltransferase GlmU [Frankiaceae bacterium]MBV9369148.1 bifunctional UDP-N-acetylglucosamine diphosphorylase/glucosamine-1-phosphate N-acetyltransferase GlmU [Frankiales bacterium]
MTDLRPAVAVVLAAGQGTRMKSSTAKVLHGLCGRPMVGHVLAALADVDPEQTVVVVGHERDQVTAALAAQAPHAVPVVQEPQNGTGHAVRLAMEAAGATEGAVVVVPGDAPLLTAETLRRLLARHLETLAAATLLTATMPDPKGYGRIVRDPDGHVTGIVEEKDADERIRQLDEVGTSVYVFDAAKLRANLQRLTTDNAQGEEYLTDVIGLLVADGDVVASVTADDYRETLGVNDRVQLATARRLMRDRIVEYWMREGVTITDPQTTWMGVGVRLEPDVTLHQNTQLHGSTTIRRGAVVGPDCTLRNTTVGEDATVVKSHCEDAEIGPGAKVGPFTYLRPGTRLGARTKAGAYVEMKAAEVGDDSKVPHLSYVGDAVIGERSNIGAATVFVNYDGVEKHQTTIGDDVRVGSDTMLVAPVTVHDGAYTAAGSVITDDVPPGAIGVARERQRNIEGWVERRRAGTKSAEAARRARERDTMAANDDDQGEQP